MNLIRVIFSRNPLFAYTGFAFLILSIVMIILIPVHSVQLLGINALIKPLKFSISIWLYLWTMAYLLHYVKNKRMVKYFTYFAVFVLVYEQVIITGQAFRGRLSHFNEDTVTDQILFIFMGVFITLFTLHNLYVAIKFKRQNDDLNPAFKNAIYYSIIIFVTASFIGGIMGGINSHQVGGEMGGDGLALVNWSTQHGDLRIAHFIGIHAIQIIPLFAFWFIRSEKKNPLKLVQRSSIIYALIVGIILIQALLGLPLIPISG